VAPQQREFLKGSLDLMLLALLEEGPMYGYAMVKEARTRSAGVLALKEGSLYPALHRLERQGLVESFWQPREDGVSRRYYRLTVEGRAALPARREEWRGFVAAVAGVVQHG
jgi:PadR family transcriptional regulator, regulatory protein PadR